MKSYIKADIANNKATRAQKSEENKVEWKKSYPTMAVLIAGAITV